MNPEQLTAIDRELDAFGKGADALRAVATRARELAASLAGDEALAALLAEASAAAAAAAERTRAEITAAAPERPPISEHVPKPSLRPERERRSGPAPAPAARKAKKAKEHPSRPLEVPPVAPEAPAPTGFDGEPATMVMTAAAVAGQTGPDSAPPGASDIAGMSVDELFADAEPVAAAPQDAGLAGLFAGEALPGEEGAAPSGNLADLFEDEQPEDDEPTMVGSLADLFTESEEVRLSDLEMEAPTGASPSTAVLDPFSDPFSDEDDEETGHFSPAQMGRIRAGERAEAQEEVEVPIGEDDFELLVDEDVLELDPDAAPAGDDEEPKKPGLIGRLFGKK